MLIDTHCHLADPAYDPDRSEVLARAWAGGVARVVVIGESPEAADRALALAAAEPRLSVDGRRSSARRRRLVARRRATGCARRSGDPEVVAAGEMGLDYHYDHSPRHGQRAAFEAQLALAREAGKPAVIHAREADEDVAAVLRAAARCPRDPALVQQRSGRSCGRGSTSATMCRSAGW